MTNNENHVDGVLLVAMFMVLLGIMFVYSKPLAVCYEVPVVSHHVEKIDFDYPGPHQAGS